MSVPVQTHTLYFLYGDRIPSKPIGSQASSIRCPVELKGEHISRTCLSSSCVIAPLHSTPCREGNCTTQQLHSTQQLRQQRTGLWAAWLESTIEMPSHVPRSFSTWQWLPALFLPQPLPHRPCPCGSPCFCPYPCTSVEATTPSGA